MKVKIKVTYNLGEDGSISAESDRDIRARMESVGGEWYAQGTDIRTGERDLCFDLEVKE